MSDIFSILAPFFGLIALGFILGKIFKTPESGLSWLNIFILYLALPALFFDLLSKTPIEELRQPGFIIATSLSTLCVFFVAYFYGLYTSGKKHKEATIQAIAGAYSNIGYMGPGLTLATLGSAATVPTALIFCFDNALIFTLAPLMMALYQTGQKSLLTVMLLALKKVLLHPFILATIAGILAAAFEVRPPQALGVMLEFLKNAAAPCALFALGVTISLRPVKRIPTEMPFLLFIKMMVHPVLILFLVSLFTNSDPVWLTTAVLMASLPPALNVFILAQNYQIYIERASTLVLSGTALSTLTLSALIFWIAEKGLIQDLIP